MIAPQELRLGNLVTIDNPDFHKKMKDVPVKINGIQEIRENDFNKSSASVTVTDGRFSYSQFNEFLYPIELNEDWLEKFGFDSNNVAYKIDNDRFVFELYFYDAWNLNYVEKQKFGNGSVELSGYWKIHELQNLFFDFTGEELTIKEQS